MAEYVTSSDFLIEVNDSISKYYKHENNVVEDLGKLVSKLEKKSEDFNIKLGSLIEKRKKSQEKLTSKTDKIGSFNTGKKPPVTQIESDIISHRSRIYKQYREINTKICHIYKLLKANNDIINREINSRDKEKSHFSRWINRMKFAYLDIFTI